ncbi:MAG: hypothetical protein IID15_00550 [Candidatus Marinimicrobia bacterium]|nr:hypothetical protein [Candidatus Neomarinimicrobiota bacterium]
MSKEVCAMHGRILTFAFIMLTTSALSAGGAEQVEYLQVPDGGIQPQAVADAHGTLHLVYYQGASKQGNLYYVTRAQGQSGWSSPIQVNSMNGSADRNEAISRAQIAVDPDGRVHVVWFNIRPTMYWYTRKAGSDAGFETQRNLVTRYSAGVESGASIAVDGQGGVFVAWHAGDFAHEDQRAVYMTRSNDGGQTFGREVRVNPDDSGACACCGLKTMVGGQGTVYVSYRAAGDKVHRNMVLLNSTDGGASFVSTTVHAWNIHACPVSTTTIAGGPGGPAVAWETQGQVYFAKLSDLGTVIGAPGESSVRRKNPAMAINREGLVLLAWAEALGYRAGGQLYWQIYSAGGAVTESRGQLEESLPDFSIPEVVAMSDGKFVIIY